MKSAFNKRYRLFWAIAGLFLLTACAPEELSVFPGDSPEYHNRLFGPGVFIFEEGMDSSRVQALIDTIYNRQSGRGSEFNENRIAFLFMPGKYRLDVKTGYYTQVIGLGDDPSAVEITGAVRSKARSERGHVLTNFWRAVENLSIVPAVEPANVWGVSQAAPLRRVVIKGDLQLHDNGYASGGFMAGCSVEGTVYAGQQQQWFTRNSRIGKWDGGQWNIFFMGVDGAPAENWPEGPVTVLDSTPVIREKPYLVFRNGSYYVNVPDRQENLSGTGREEGRACVRSLPLSSFFIVRPECTAEELNRALEKGRNVFFTPGVYRFEQTIRILKPGTVVLGIGMPSLFSTHGNPVMELADADGMMIAGLLFDAGEENAETLLKVGETKNEVDHSSDPIFLSDLFFRVGGALEGKAGCCLTINSNDVYVDHTWLWRADHGKGVGWEQNRGANGLIVNGDRVTIYGLFNEHFQEYQTLWNGDSGRTFFYQSELPYDPPVQDDWKHDTVLGYASYKVADHVTSHEAVGLGIYSYFRDAAITEDNAMVVPPVVEAGVRHIMTFWLNGNEQSRIGSVINGKGEAVDAGHRKTVYDK
ncbi:MAG: adenylyl cyclase [Bacteroidota bacterium]